MDRVGELAQVAECGAQIALQFVQGLLAARVAAAQPLPGQRQPRGQGDQVLLKPVMQVTLDPLPLGVLGLRDPGPRGDQLDRLPAVDLEPDAQLRAQVQVAYRSGGLTGQVREQSAVFVQQRPVPAGAALDARRASRRCARAAPPARARPGRPLRRPPCRSAGGHRAAARHRAVPAPTAAAVPGRSRPRAWSAGRQAPATTPAARRTWSAPHNRPAGRRTPTGR